MQQRLYRRVSSAVASRRVDRAVVAGRWMGSTFPSVSQRQLLLLLKRCGQLWGLDRFVVRWEGSGIVVLRVESAASPRSKALRLRIRRGHHAAQQRGEGRMRSVVGIRRDSFRDGSRPNCLRRRYLKPPFVAAEANKGLHARRPQPPDSVNAPQCSLLADRPSRRKATGRPFDRCTALNEKWHAVALWTFRLFGVVKLQREEGKKEEREERTTDATKQLVVTVNIQKHNSDSEVTTADCWTRTTFARKKK